jgi:hypothetical protein
VPAGPGSIRTERVPVILLTERYADRIARALSRYDLGWARSNGLPSGCVEQRSASWSGYRPSIVEQH